VIGWKLLGVARESDNMMAMQVMKVGGEDGEECE
jgi:hypothetical protein